jgi:hypothetical protein
LHHSKLPTELSNIKKNLIRLLPAAIHVTETKLHHIPTDSGKFRSLLIVGRRISDISEDFCEQLIGQLKNSRFAFKVAEPTDVVKYAHLITYVRYVLENNIKEGFWFCKLLMVELRHWNCAI